MIYDANELAAPRRLKADLCVIGSGPGGATVAMIAAEAGLSTIVLEAGAFLTPSDMTQREEQMFPKLLRLSGSVTTKDRAVRIHQGKGVGGSSLHNLNLCKRVHPSILESWFTQHRLARLDLETWDALYAEAEELLSVTAVDPALWNRHNRLLRDACEALGFAGGGLKHNRTGCLQSGFCELGCAYDAKNNAFKVMMPRAVKAGCEVITHCQAVRVTYDRGRATGVDAVSLDPDTGRPTGAVAVEADRVCVSASATGTAALLLRSKIADESGRCGRGLRIHPAVVVAGDFEEPVDAHKGIPQTYECTELLELDKPDGHRTWIVPAFGHPMGVATMLPGHGDAHYRLMKRYRHLGVLTAMLHDETEGVVEPDGDLGLSIDYWPHAADRAELEHGLRACARLLFAAGATRVYVPGANVMELASADELGRLDALKIERGSMDVTAVHPMASVPMSDDPKGGPVDSAGRHHQLGGLWVADGSLFPTSIGGPPQLSIYALGLHVGRQLVAAS